MRKKRTDANSRWKAHRKGNYTKIQEGNRQENPPKPLHRCKEILKNMMFHNKKEFKEKRFKRENRRKWKEDSRTQKNWKRKIKKITEMKAFFIVSFLTFVVSFRNEYFLWRNIYHKSTILQVFFPFLFLHHNQKKKKSVILQVINDPIFSEIKYTYHKIHPFSVQFSVFGIFIKLQAIIAIYYLVLKYFHCSKERLHAHVQSLPVPSSLALSNHRSFCLSGFSHSEHFIWMDWYTLRLLSLASFMSTQDDPIWGE